jgi:uncharacterized protein YegL
MMNKIPVLLVPVLFLLCYLLALPFYLPAVLLPETVFTAVSSATEEAGLLETLNKHRSLHLLLDGEIRRVFRRQTRISDIARLLEEHPPEDLVSLKRYAGMMARRVPLFGKAAVLTGSPPHALELEALGALQDTGLPVRLRVEELPPAQPLLMGYSVTQSRREKGITVELLFSPAVEEVEELTVTPRGGEPLRLDTPALTGAAGAARTRFRIEEEGEHTLRIRAGFAGGQEELLLRVVCPPTDDPAVLMVSDRPDALSYLEQQFSVKKVSPSAAAEEDLMSHPLIVLDGLPLKSLSAEFSAALAELYASGSSSLFFVSDSPGFGARGDNPVLEEILPVELSPRSLKYLPDMGILILLDISASMMGEKLSLAKVSTLELVRNLKESDRVSLMTFWDRYETEYDFTLKKAINTEAGLEPLIAQGGTDLYPALEAGMQRLLALSMEQKHIIILSDGNTKERDFDPLLDLAALENLTISTLSVGEDANQALLKRISRKTGGNNYPVLDLKEIPSLIFEDRREISRSAFGRDEFLIYAAHEEPVAVVTGMSLFTPKPERLMLYRNQFEDPLLIMEKRGDQLVLMFHSDLYGVYSADFFNRPGVIATLKHALDTALDRERLAVRLAEDRRSLAVTLAGEGLVSPHLAVYADNRLIVESDPQRGSMGSFSAQLQLPRRGAYTAVFSDLGTTFAALPFYFNAQVAGTDTDSAAGLSSYRTRLFKRLDWPPLYLLLFLLSSVFATYRFRRRRGEGQP